MKHLFPIFIFLIFSGSASAQDIFPRTDPATNYLQDSLLDYAKASEAARKSFLYGQATGANRTCKLVRMVALSENNDISMEDAYDLFESCSASYAFSQIDIDIVDTGLLTLAKEPFADLVLIDEALTALGDTRDDMDSPIDFGEAKQTLIDLAKRR